MRSRRLALVAAAGILTSQPLFGADKKPAGSAPAVAAAADPRGNSFAPLRRVLLQANVPFDPDVLQQNDWRDRLAAALKVMPEMSRSISISGMSDGGGIIADVVTVSGDLKLSQDTVILARRIIFDSAEPVIWAPGKSIGFFPIDSVEHTDTSLPPHAFRGFEINVDAKGAGPRKGLKRRPLDTNVDGNTGAKGPDGSPGAAGPDGGVLAPAPDGSCGANPDGTNGIRGADGGHGSRGGDGTAGGTGFPAGIINATIPACQTGSVVYSARGGAGGIGGSGGIGGRGGNGGPGQTGGNGAACCPVKLGSGGSGGNGGNSADGGSGGDAKPGGNGGPAGNITVLNHSLSVTISAYSNGGPGGQPGQAGQVGSNGTPGAPGAGGMRAPGSGCPQGSNGNSGSYGYVIAVGNEPGASANAGNPGQSTTPNITNDYWNCGFGCGGGGLLAPSGSAAVRGRRPLSRCSCDECPDDPCCGFSPIIVDLSGEGVRLSGPDDPVRFDLDADGLPELTAWTERGSTTGFLVLDHNGNGFIDDGSELFGDHTVGPGGTRAPNGYVALAAFDEPANGGDGDGRITVADSVFPYLGVWVDTNHNGVSEPGELLSLTEAGVVSIDLGYKEERRVDQYGNAFRYHSWATMERDHGEPRRVSTYDVYFVRVP